MLSHPQLLMKMKTHVLKAKPQAAIRARPWEVDLIRNASVTVELRCSQMGLINQRKMVRLGTDWSDTVLFAQFRTNERPLSKRHPLNQFGIIHIEKLQSNENPSL